MKRFAAVLLLVVAAACGERAVEPPPTEPAEQPRTGGTLVRRLASDVNTLNLVRHSLASEKYVLSYLYDPLIEFDRDLRLVPGLAREWDISPDGSVYTLKLDPRARFHDGSPVRASDVLFTLKKIVDPASESVQLSGLFDALDLERTRVLDHHTIEVAFTDPLASQIYAFNIGVLPESVYGKGDFRNDYNDTAIGTGPYRLVRREAGQQITLEKWDGYWRDKPWIARVVFRVIGDDTVAWNALRKGEVDETRITTTQFRETKDDPSIAAEFDVYETYLLGYNFIAWNTERPALADPRVRRALTLALNRKEIVDVLYYGSARILSGPFVPGQKEHNPEVETLPFDPERAVRLLDEAGWRDGNGDGLRERDGKPLRIEMSLISGNEISSNQAQIFQRDLKQIGVDLTLRSMDAASVFDRVLSGNYDAAFLGFNLDADPDVYSLFHSSQVPPAGQNFVRYSNPEVDRLIEVARREIDPEKRAGHYRALHARLADDQPYTWTVQAPVRHAIRKRVRNVEDSKGFGIFYWYPGPLQWWLADAGEAP